MTARTTSRFAFCAILLTAALASGCVMQNTPTSDSADALKDPPPLSIDDTESVQASLEDLFDTVYDLDIERFPDDDVDAGEGPSRASALVVVDQGSLEETRVVDQAAFFLLDLMQHSTPATASLQVEIQAPEPVSHPADDAEWTMVGRMYTWEPRIDHPFAVPTEREDTITLWSTTTSALSEIYRGVGSAEPIAIFRDITAEVVSKAADGMLPEAEPWVKRPFEYELRPNSLSLGFELPLPVTEYRAGVEYVAEGMLGYSGTDSRGRPLHKDLTLYLPHGAPLELVLRDVESGTETISRPGEGPAVEMVLKPETGLSEEFPFVFPHPGRYEVFLRIAGEGDPARTKGVWIDVTGQ